MENDIPRLSPGWEHSLTNILGHDPTTEAGRSLRQWVPCQGVHSLLALLSWDPEEFQLDPSQTIYDLNGHRELLHLRTNQIKQVASLITYMRHIFESYNSGPGLPEDTFQPFTPDEWMTHTALHMRIYLGDNICSPLGLYPAPYGPISSSRPTCYSSSTLDLIGFKTGINTQIAAYPSLKNERYILTTSLETYLL